MSGTIFENTRTPLTTWFQAFWWIVTRKKGATALGLQTTFSLKSYQTAWIWLHKIRKVMRASMVEPLTGKVELGIYSFRPAGTSPSRSPDDDVIRIALATRVGRGGHTSVRGGILTAEDPSSPESSLSAFVTGAILKGTTIVTDSSPVFDSLPKLGYRHKFIEPPSKGRILPRVSVLCARLDQWLKDPRRGAVATRHLVYYLDEYLFRCNQARAGSDADVFLRLLCFAVGTQPLPYKSVVQPGRSAAASKAGADTGAEGSHVEGSKVEYSPLKTGK